MKVTLLVVTLVGLNVINVVAGFAKLDEVFSWKDVSFEWPSEEAKNNAIKNGDYVVGNSLPLGLARWKNKLFVTLPRWKTGIPSTLNYVLLNGTDQSPALIPYPNWESNQLPKEKDSVKETTIVSVFRIHVDVCDRLWVLDNGLADIFGGGKHIISPTITVWNLNTDELLHKYTLKPEDVTTESFFANIVVDVTKDKCDQAFAYVPDLGGYGLVVYSLAVNNSWRIRHNYFHFDPLKGDLLIGGINFQWSDGIFGIALGPIESDGYRTAYFHPMISDSEFSVNTRVWQNKTLALDRASYHSYKVEGNKGNNSQSTASSFDENTNVIFFAQLQKDGIGCWNSKKELKPENVDLVAQDHEKLLFPNDIKLDEERNLWILSDKLPYYFHDKLDYTQINYRIMKVPVDEAIKDTKPSGYNSNILIGNWFEENCSYKKYKYEHCSEYSIEYNKKAPTVVPATVIWDNKIQSEGHGIHPEVFTDEVPNFYHNFSTLYDLSYNHFPKKFNKRRCLCDEMPDYLKSYGNLTNYGIMEEKREQWKYEQIPIQYTMNEIDFIHPKNDCYKFTRW